MKSIRSLAKEILGERGVRFVRELTGARHKVQVKLATEMAGENVDDMFAFCPTILPPGPIVYSLGVGTVIDADLYLVEHYHAYVYAFDPTPIALEWIATQKVPDRWRMLPYGVADFDGPAIFFHHVGAQFGLKPVTPEDRATNPLQVRRISTIMRELSHDHIDILKINIEGGEYAVLRDLLRSDVRVGQLWVEFHHRFPGLRLQQTIEAVRQLNANGYLIFAIAENEKEYSFVNRRELDAD